MNQPARSHRSDAEVSGFAVKPLSPALSAEIVGLDRRQELSSEIVAQLIKARHQHLVLLFRDQLGVLRR